MHFRRYRNDINHCLWALLVCFLAVRGLVPAGFMPSALSDGGPYQLCHGDSRAALLLNSLQASPVQEGHHRGHHAHHHSTPDNTPGSGHNHDAATAKHFADSTCAFAAAATSHVDGGSIELGTPAAPTRSSSAALRHFHSQPAYLTPPGRAPPLAT